MDMNGAGGSVLMHKYEIGRLLGKGTFAKVYYSRNIETGQSFAIKVINKDKVMRVGLMKQIKREISVMRLVRHPNIVQLYEVMATKSKIYFVMQYMKGGELFDKVAKGRLKEDVARKFFQQLISAVDYCHSRGVYHRDLKPENLLLDENGNLKVSDFGLSTFADSKSSQDGLLYTTCGTPAYVAPEVISRKGYDGAKADIWCCGVILFVLVAGYLPFHDSNLMEMYRKIGRAEFTCPTWFPLDLRKLVVRILDPNPSTRISMSKIMENSWVKKHMVSSKNYNGISQQRTLGIPNNLNAFDIISLASGFDLSGLFEEENQDSSKEARFISKDKSLDIISKIENIAEKINFKVKEENGGGCMVVKMEGLDEGRKGVLEINAEIFEVASSSCIVDINKKRGDTMEYQRLWKNVIKPELRDIVWTWQGKKQQHQVEVLEHYL